MKTLRTIGHLISISQRVAFSVLIVGVTIANSVERAQASDFQGRPCKPGEQGVGGVVWEHGPPNTTFDVFLTDWMGNITPGGAFARLNNGAAGGKASTIVPSGMKDVCDAKNVTIPVGVAGGGGGGWEGRPISTLNIECIFIDETINEHRLCNVFDVVGNLRPGVGARMPDLYADTNGDGVIGTGDNLYSLINLNDALTVPEPSFSLGDPFNIVNGRVAELPSMYFSSTPFVFDLANIGAVDGLIYTPFTGKAVAITDHAFFDVPGPLPLLGVAAAFGYSRKLRKRIKESKSLSLVGAID